jgi:hypothetical protein
MNDFKVNDLVIIVRQPIGNHPNNHINMRGLSGYIEEINGEYAQFVELKENGCGGMGAVPLSHLKLANDDIRLQSLKLAKDERYQKVLKENLERTKRYNDKLEAAAKDAADKTGVSMRNVLRIFELHQEAIDDLHKNYGW